MRRLLLTCLVAAGLAWSPIGLQAQTSAGQPDTTFGRHGQVHLDVGGYERPSAMVAYPDGRVAVVIETEQGLVVVRRNADGAPDLSFGPGGTRQPISGKVAGAPDMFITRDGGLLIVAWVVDSRTDQVARQRLVLLKLRRDGSRDHAFGDRHGMVEVTGDLMTRSGTLGVAAAMTHDGGVAVLGLAGVSLGYFGYPGTAAVLRFGPDGRIDRRFGVGGLSPLYPSPVVPGSFDIAVDRRGRIVVGTTDWSGGPFAQTLLVSRLTPRGLHDRSFGTAGITAFTFGGEWNVMTDLATDENRIVVFGFGTNGVAGTVAQAALRPNEEHRGFTPTLVRLTEAGSLDPSFGQSGRVLLQRDRRGRGLLWSDELIVDSARRPIVDAVVESGRSASLIRLTEAGSVDLSFEQPDLPFDSYARLVTHGSRLLATGYRVRNGSTAQYSSVIAAYRV